MRSLLILSFAILSPRVPAQALKQDPVRTRILAEARLTAFVRTYERYVKTPADFANVFTYGAKHRYQRDWAAFVRGVGPLPRISREGLTLVLHSDAGDVHMDFTDFALNRVNIEGMPWVYDPTAPPRLHAELLQAKLRAWARSPDPSGSAALWSAFLPRAEAQMPQLVKPVAKSSFGKSVIQKVCNGNCTLIGMVLGGVGVATGSVQDLANKMTCYFNYSIDARWPFKAGFCNTWKDDYETREAKERIRATANWGALKKKLTWTSKDNPKCLAKNPDGSESYSLKLEQVGTGNETERTVYFTGRGMKGVLTDAAVYANEADAKAPDAVQRALASYVFHVPAAGGIVTAPVVTDIRVLDPDLENTPARAGASRHVMVPLSRGRHEIKLSLIDPVQRYVALLDSAQDWLITCQTIKTGATANPGATGETVGTMLKEKEEAKPATTQPEDSGTPATR